MSACGHILHRREVTPCNLRDCRMVIRKYPHEANGPSCEGCWWRRHGFDKWLPRYWGRDPGNVQELARALDAACGESKVLLMWRGGGERRMGGMFGPFTVAGIVLMSPSAVNVVRARLSANTLLKVRPCWRALSHGLGVAAGTVAHWVLWFDWLGKRD